MCGSSRVIFSANELHNIIHIYIYVLQNQNGILNRLSYVISGCSNECGSNADTQDAKQASSIEKRVNKAFNQDEYKTLYSMVYGVKFHGIVQHLCIGRFHLIYWLPEQPDL